MSTLIFGGGTISRRRPKVRVSFKKHSWETFREGKHLYPPITKLDTNRALLPVLNDPCGLGMDGSVKPASNLKAISYNHVSKLSQGTLTNRKINSSVPIFSFFPLLMEMSVNKGNSQGAGSRREKEQKA